MRPVHAAAGGSEACATPSSPLQHAYGIRSLFTASSPKLHPIAPTPVEKSSRPSLAKAMALTLPLMRRLATHWRLRSDTSGMVPPSPQNATSGSEEGEEDLGSGRRRTGLRLP